MLQELLETTQKSVKALDPFIAEAADFETRDTLRVIQARGKGMCEVIEQVVKVGDGHQGVPPDLAELTANVTKFNGAVSKFLDGAGRV